MSKTITVVGIKEWTNTTKLKPVIVDENNYEYLLNKETFNKCFCCRSKYSGCKVKAVLKPGQDHLLVKGIHEHQNPSVAVQKARKIEREVIDKEEMSYCEKESKILVKFRWNFGEIA